MSDTCTLLAFGSTIVGSQGGSGGSMSVVNYTITLPTTGYTTETVTIWGESKEVKSITLTTDKNGNALSNFTAGMVADYLINLSGTFPDFKKVYAHEIGAGSVTFYLTDVPSAAMDVLVREAVPSGS